MKANHTDFDFDDRPSPPPNMDVGNQTLQRAEDDLSNRWNMFQPHDSQYWRYGHKNRRHLESTAAEDSQDKNLLWPIGANVILDLLLFHSLADYLVRSLIPAAPTWLILLATVLFPLVYIASEFKLAQFIQVAVVNWRKNPYGRWLTFWVAFWYVAGFCWAVFPSAVFAYVMHLSQAENQLSWIFVGILALLGVIIHLTIVFGGESVIEAKTRWEARGKEKKLARRRLKSYRALRQAAGKTKGIASHFAQIAQQHNTVLYFVGLSQESLSIIEFIDQGYFNLHPKDRPSKYRFRKYWTPDQDDEDPPAGQSFVEVA